MFQLGTSLKQALFVFKWQLYLGSGRRGRTDNVGFLLTNCVMRRMLQLGLCETAAG